jgi:hypothetical protein
MNDYRHRTVVREVRHSADPLLTRGHQLLRRIFPRREMVSRIEWRDSLREREARLWTDLRWHLVVARAGQRVLGVATGNYLGNVNTGMVGYVAVTSAARRAGIGPRLRDELRRLFERDAREILGKRLKAVVGEVRRDNPWLRSLIRRDRVLALDFRYFQPGLRHAGRPVPLVFYYESLGAIRTRLPAVELRRLLYTIWRRIYRIARPLADPAFRRTLRDLAGRRWIGELRLPPSPSSPRDTAGGNHA